MRGVARDQRSEVLCFPTLEEFEERLRLISGGLLVPLNPCR